MNLNLRQAGSIFTILMHKHFDVLAWIKTFISRGNKWYYKSMGAFCCHGNQSLDPICPKTFTCSLFPHPKNASYKIWSRLTNWPQRYSSFIWKVMTEWHKDRMTEPQNPEGQGKSSIAPTFSKRGSKRGYKYTVSEKQKERKKKLYILFICIFLIKMNNYIIIKSNVTEFFCFLKEYFCSAWSACLKRNAFFHWENFAVTGLGFHCFLRSY